MSHTFQAGAGASSFSDRRFHARQRVLLSAIELGDENGGIVLNLSEGGLALHAVSEVAGDELPNLRFQFSQTETWVEIKGRITWRSASKKAAGVEFIDLPDEARHQIQEWIAVTGDSGRVDVKAKPREQIAPMSGEEPFAAPPAKSFPKPFSASDLSAAGKQDAGKASVAEVPAFGGIVHRPETVRHILLPLLLGGLLVSALAFAVRIRRNPGTTGNSAALSIPASTPPPPVEIALKQPIAPARAPSVGTPGYVIQVGALAREDDADKLAASLQKRKFPAFVFRRSGSHLYHVVVGPYNKADSVAVANKLEERGFDVIRSEWKPEAQ